MTRTNSPDRTPPIEPLPDFAAHLIAWHARHGRHDLPWQHPRTPYRVWLSEIMLQQTQVATVIPYFERFVAALPDLRALAEAPLDRVLALWSGLGYYSRARNLHAAARACAQCHGSELPDDIDALVALPGIGRSTAGAILAQAHGRRAAILDGNVKRVLCRSHGVDGFPGEPAVERALWQLAEALLPDDRLVDYTQAVMDLGATVCMRAKPDCAHCPLRADCRAYRDGRVAQLPVPRPRRALPERTAVWLVLRDPQQRVLLERRPESGIWGGLWSLPEFPDAAALQAALALDYAGAHDQSQPLPPIRHVFSHYALTARPISCRLHRPDGRIGERGHRRWLSRADLDATGLPQPVRRLLAGLWSDETTFQLEHA